jgi:peptidyl-prolyl cis-trans isomerase A (cyclophilin A)
MPLRAVFKTSHGTFVCRLFEAEAPETVANFIELAEGLKPWKSRTRRDGRLYDGTLIHRVVRDFFIQGGDPDSDGEGGPGYVFADETQGSPYTFSKPGMLAMANRGMNTNGSQFFVSTVAADWLTGSNTIFGEVIHGIDVVQRISQLPTGFLERPLTPVVLQSVKVGRVGTQAMEALLGNALAEAPQVPGVPGQCAQAAGDLAPWVGSGLAKVS